MTLIEKLTENTIADACPYEFGMAMSENEGNMCRYTEEGKIDLDRCKECWNREYVPRKVKGEENEERDEKLLDMSE